jgi:RNA recognition motif-containing protein
MYVGNLPYQYREGDMRAIFEPFGPIKSISIPMEHEGRKNRGYCFVDFEVRADAEKAMAKCQDTGLEIEGRRLRLDWDVTPMEQRRITN